MLSSVMRSEVKSLQTNGDYTTAGVRADAFAQEGVELEKEAFIPTSAAGAADMLKTPTQYILWAPFVKPKLASEEVIAEKTAGAGVVGGVVASAATPIAEGLDKAA